MYIQLTGFNGVDKIQQTLRRNSLRFGQTAGQTNGTKRSRLERRGQGANQAKASHTQPQLMEENPTI
ncbi:hypothetical protein GCM10028804_24040 [Larkinella terrae]